MVRTNQGGSVLSFVVIGVVMVALLVGGAYYVQRQTVLPAMDPSQPAPQPEDKPSSEESSDKPAEETTPQKNDDQSKQQQETTPPPSASEDTNNDAELPQTGPAELVATLLALGFLSLTAVSYARSRHPELSL